MAKKKKGARLPAEAATAAAPGAAPKSMLEAAWQAYTAGDMVRARRASRQLLGGAANAADTAFAAHLAPELFGRPDAAGDAAAVAAELARRTEPPARAYLFAGVAAAVFVLLLLIARRG